MLHGRGRERAVVGKVIDGVRGGASGALVLRGDPGMGKTSLLGYADKSGLRLLSATGTESEATLPYAGLHLLLHPVLDRIEALPDVQAAALRGVLGLASGASPPDRFLIGLAVLSLLSELADDGPLLVIVDDAHWLDRDSAEALLFAARRLGAEPVGILFATRTTGFPAPGLPSLDLPALDPAAAETLLDAQSPGLDPAARSRVLADAGGNPLALIELPASDTSATGGLTDRLRDAFQSRLTPLPPSLRTLLALAAALGPGDVRAVLRAAATLDAGPADLDTAIELGLINRDLSFRHSLLRAAVWDDTPPGRRLTLHAALAAALDSPSDADCRAWHSAAAATGTDERVAAELERTAAWAGDRSGHTAAAAAYERAATLSADPAARLRRLTLAAEASAESGDLDHSDTLAAQAERLLPHAACLDVEARLTTVRASADFWRGAAPSAHDRLLRGATRAAVTDPHLALSMLIESLHVGWYTSERELSASVERIRAALLPGDPLDPLARLLIHAAGPVVGAGEVATELDWAAAGALTGVARAGGDEPGMAVLVAGTALILGQDAVTVELAAEQVESARRNGRVGWLPQALFYLAAGWQFAGWHGEATAAAEEGLAIAEDTDQRQWVKRLGEPLAYLAAFAGDEERCRQITDRALASSAGDPAWQVPWVHATLGLLELGRGRAEAALNWLTPLADGRPRFHISATRSTPDLVEAAVRAERADEARAAFAHYRRWAAFARQPWIDAIVVRCEALLGPDATAGATFERALALHRTTARPFDEARTALLYGEWLRRARRRTEARTPLTVALEGFERAGAVPWAARARAELTAAGSPAPEPRTGPAARLTPQELQIARLAARGLSNKDIAARLFLSARTVGYHLYKAYPKLGVASRGELAALELGG